MGNSLQRQSPRAIREAKAYRAVKVGVVTGVGTAVTTLLWLVGLMGDHPAMALFVATILCVVKFSYAVGILGEKGTH
jgi:Kef-type K+ transport system membrane component KefB